MNAPVIATDWPRAIFEELKAAGVTQVPYVPDAGHKALIALCHAEPTMHAIPLTTEEEGIALLAGGWLGGARGVMLMQSSGVGNCLNMLSLARTGRFPMLFIVTMRGEWGEFNGWQTAMGAATPDTFRLMDVPVQRIEDPEDVRETVRQAAVTCFGGGTSMAILLAQRLIGAKVFVK